MKSLFRTMIASVAVLAVPTIALAQDAAKGENVFKRCTACHAVGAGAKNKVGPVLNGVVGRKAGTAADYKYSALNQEAGAAGLEWTEANLMEYLVDPSAFLEKFIKEKGGTPTGKSKMVFKLPKEDERKDVIAYLKTQQ